MAKRNGALLVLRVAAIIVATLCFTTLGLPFSPMHRVKMTLTGDVKPVAVHQQFQLLTNKKQEFTTQLQPEVEIDDLDQRLLFEYGAVLKARNGVVLPPREMFSSDEQAAAWRSKVATSGENYVLQTAAAEALNAAREEARGQGLDITPRDTDSAARDFAYTVELWMSRVNPGLDHWVKKGRLESAEAERIRTMLPREQVVAILQLEKQGLFFSKDFSKSILCSVAPPGASQHLALLAFDVKEHQDLRVRQILARHGWYQTVQRDEPHFTYLGVRESELLSLGLVAKPSGGRIYWVPGPKSFDGSMELVASR
ncbi:MAG TPA: hypothetical protein VLK33_16540 [Terriglobales bacterium]|nr:hypothetical protein [Terriglobales bacterium]